MNISRRVIICRYNAPRKISEPSGVPLPRDLRVRINRLPPRISSPRDLCAPFLYTRMCNVNFSKSKMFTGSHVRKYGDSRGVTEQ